MARVIRFFTASFDVTKERPNPINPIFGESLLLWLIGKVQGTLEISAPEAEDWGWYSYAHWKGRKYLLGAAACATEKAGLREWVLQIDKLRSTKEKLLKHGHMSHDDECAQFFQNILEHEATFRDVSVDPEL
ncbi:hypothetical protein [Paludibaculum fermentans]|uniref:Uncharacterized protein n=1 Tax=Paludibaculum fermentans TaxID=1473598 RepID=A0A7S7NW92_PALFE|nr:hypothetical protein [Paludibaculum fermentans]QOY90965.1 hypothetical protein IRI77_13760 [Paludibaculum fermentans]